MRIALRKWRLEVETDMQSRGRPLMLSLAPRSLSLREKGRRVRYEVPYDAIYSVGAKMEAVRQKLERARAGRRGR